MPVLPPNQLEPNAAPWGRKITDLVLSHDNIIGTILSKLVVFNRNLNSNINQLTEQATQIADLEARVAALEAIIDV
jgi:hypothetical protein